MMLLPVAFKGLLVAAGAAASWSDVFYRRIPNWLCAAAAIAGLVFGFLSGGLPMLGSQALHAAIAFFVGMLLFKFGVLGGGDAKFYAAIAAWFTLSEAAILLLLVSFSGLLLLIVWFLFRRVMGKPFNRFSKDPGDSLPYGIAIGIGAIVAKLALT